MAFLYNLAIQGIEKLLHGNAFRITGPLWGESSGYLTEASDVTLALASLILWTNSGYFGYVMARI